ncbi:MAG: YHS domain-containing protein [Alphaproteobacteria bacterium]
MAVSKAAKASTILRDPVCGMTVDPEAGKPFAEHDGHRYHFCAERCRERFLADPEAFVSAEDPVCGMHVDRASARFMAKHAGERFYFCSAHCQEKFEQAPEVFLGDRPAPEPMPAGTQYTCPMDPEIIRDEPGDCPICGMALEPMMPSADAGPNPELVDFKRRLWIGAPLALAVFVLEMGTHVGIPFDRWLGHTAFLWLQALLAAPVVLWVGAPFFKRGWSSIVNQSPNMWDSGSRSAPAPPSCSASSPCSRASSRAMRTEAGGPLPISRRPPSSFSSSSARSWSSARASAPAMPSARS